MITYFSCINIPILDTRQSEYVRTRDRPFKFFEVVRGLLKSVLIFLRTLFIHVFNVKIRYFGVVFFLTFANIDHRRFPVKIIHIYHFSFSRSRYSCSIKIDDDLFKIKIKTALPFTSS